VIISLRSAVLAVLMLTEGVGVGVDVGVEDVEVDGVAVVAGVDRDDSAALLAPLPLVLVLHPARRTAATIKATVVPRAGVMDVESTNSCRTGWIWSPL
jgi:hypothetical protein